MPTQVNLLPKHYQVAKPSRFYHKKGFRLGAIALLPIALVSYFTILQPAQPLVSPLANPDQPEIVRQSLQEDRQPLAYYIAASQKYLTQARTVSRQKGVNQTAGDKNKIISLLNESLKHANNAVKYYPQSPESYQTRAKLFENLAVLDDSAQGKADQDLALAAKLGAGESVPNISPADLIEYSPIQEANLNKNVAIAFPEDEKVVDTVLEEESNALRGTAIIAAGETSIVVSSEFVTNDNLIYFTPEGDTLNEIISLKSKSEKNQEFTLKLSNPLPHDLTITWWIVQ